MRNVVLLKPLASGFIGNGFALTGQDAPHSMRIKKPAGEQAARKPFNIGRSHRGGGGRREPLDEGHVRMSEEIAGRAPRTRTSWGLKWRSRS